jgi:two-component system sensor histidine kinase UhpB
MSTFREWSRRLHVFWKIQIANTAFLLAATWAAAWTGAHGHGFLSVGLGLVAAALAIAASAFLLKVALRPLERVVATMETVTSGDTQARAEAGGDPWAGVIGSALNHMLDRLGAEQRAAAGAAMLAEDAERRRIAQELHDDPCQRLARLTAALQDQPALAGEALDILEGLRRNMAALHPAVLDDLGFSAALRWLARDEGQPAVHVEVQAPAPSDPQAAHAVFRVAQEAVANAARHGHAQNVWIRWDAVEDGRQLQVEDDGRGFDPGSPTVGRYGLRGMRSRARALGGQLLLEAAPGRGTLLTLVCPNPCAVVVRTGGERA